MRTGHQFIEQDSQRKNVGRGSNGLPSNLLGARVIGCQNYGRGTDFSLCVLAQKLGDTKIEQINRSGLRNQNVARLQIAMNGKITMGVLNGVGNLQKQS